MTQVTPPSSSNKINLLPEHIIDQIKAGEVIERPATLIKELLENSVDAGSTQINVHIINFGMDLISVEDNGVGIDFEDLPLAFCRHATSKIDQFEDLYSLYTYGFRGEALASMASVSKITCSSNKEGTPRGTIKIHGGQVVSQDQESTKLAKTGTSVYVKDLFYNTPVRMKFLQSQTSEKNQLKKIINAFILTHPEIEFSIKWDEAEKEYFPKVENLQPRIKKLFEKKKNPLQLINFESEYDQSKVELFISLNSSKGHAGRFQYIFINGRFVQDVQIHKVILNSAQSLWPFGESGSYIAFLTISPDQLDVNVHPNKTVIKLFGASSVFSLISGSIKTHLPKQNASDSNLIPRQSSLEIGKDINNFKEINYRHQDFTESNSLNNYFNSLDSNELSHLNQVDEFSILLRTQDVILYKQDEQLFLANSKEILLTYLETLLYEDKEKSSIPLLVSTPIKLDKKANNKKLDIIRATGFEFDFFDKATLILRAFPKIFSSFPPEVILNLLLQGKHEKGKWILEESMGLNYELTLSNLKSILQLCSTSILIENKSLKPIKAKDLLEIL